VTPVAGTLKTANHFMLREVISQFIHGQAEGCVDLARDRENVVTGVDVRDDAMISVIAMLLRDKTASCQYRRDEYY
jgi:hypothetical protein